ncbi:MAG: hypothetical protein JRH13_12725 [Deltaproteobacteria bacterium]|nr:hypothetical protein [Deltaproteobacteria bacterium]MBW2130217.1 hypothetical protein [Deltaproteobacteria bacterium]
MFGSSRVYTGIEIGPGRARMARVCKEKRGWRLLHCKEIPFPDGVLEPSYKKENVADPEGFISVIRELIKGIKGLSRIGLALPNESLKVTIHHLETLPKSRDGMTDFILWKEREELPFPPEQAEVAYSVFSIPTLNGKSLIAAIGSRDIIQDYERNLKRLRLTPEVIQPSSINHLNFYLPHIPSSGTFAFLGVFEKYFSFLVFEEGGPIFYRGKRRAPVAVHFLQEIDMNLELFLNEYPGREIPILYLQCQYLPSRDFITEFRDYFNIKTEIIPEEDIIILPGGSDEIKGSGDIAPFVSAIGAAQSLVI